MNLRLVAVKAVRPDLIIAGRLDLNHEVRIGGSLHGHPNIVTYYSTGEYNGNLFIVMEYLGELNLEKLVTREGTLPVESALRYASQVADALMAAHALHIGHQDIKPPNI